MVLLSHSCRFDLGYWAVFTFFVLSGYWIHRMWTQKYSRADQPVRLFYGSRLLRILPAFWLVNLVATLVLLAGLSPEYAGSKDTTWGWLHAAFANVFLLNYSDLPWAQGALRVAWSLDVELQFYLLFPLLLRLCLHPRWGRVGFLALVTLLVGGLAAFLIPADELSRNVSGFGLFFLAGALAAQWDWKPSARIAGASLLATIVIVAACWATPTARIMFENNKHGATDFLIHVRRSAQVGLAFVSIPYALSTVRVRSGEWDRRLGEFTFIVYLVHWPVMMVHGHYYEHVPPLHRAPSLAVAWTVIALLSWLVFQCFDQPIERWRRRWVASHLPA